LDALTISRLTQPLVSQKSPRETGTDRRDFARAGKSERISLPASDFGRLLAELKHGKLTRSDAPTPA
jgi:hypothetical protein